MKKDIAFILVGKETNKLLSEYKLRIINHQNQLGQHLIDFVREYNEIWNNYYRKGGVKEND